MYSTQTDVKKYSTLIEVRHVHYTDWRGREREDVDRGYTLHIMMWQGERGGQNEDVHYTD